MKFNMVTWKDYVWVLGLLVAGLFVLGYFSYEAIVNANLAVVDTETNLVIPKEYFEDFN